MFSSGYTLATISAIDNNYNCDIFNLGNNISEELMDMIGIIEKDLGKEAIIDFQSIQPGDVQESFADIEKSVSKLNYSPKISIKEGIPNFIRWYKNYNKGL